MPNNPTYFALIDAFGQAGCPVCRLVHDGIKRYLDNLFYENVNDSTIRYRLRNSLGFCNEHAWLLINARLGDSLGMALIYNDVLGNLLKRIEKDFPQSQMQHGIMQWRRLPEELRKLVEKINKLLSPQQRCLVCEQQEDNTHMILDVLVSSLEDPSFIDKLQVSGGLCLPHLKQAFRQVADSTAFADLFNISRAKLEIVHAELAELIRKNDYRFREEELGPEGNSWKRVVNLMVGNNKQP